MPRNHLPAVQSAQMLDVISHSLPQTEQIGQRLGVRLRPGDLLLLSGEVGTGKTQLAKGIALGLDSRDLVTSPSFVLMNEYHAGPLFGHLTIYHADLYRIEDHSEIEGIGLEEAWNGQGICLIEWAERAASLLPNEHLAIQIQHLSDTKRVLRFVPHGARYTALVEALKAAL